MQNVQHLNFCTFRYDFHTWGEQDIYWQTGQLWENGEFAKNHHLWDSFKLDFLNIFVCVFSREWLLTLSESWDTAEVSHSVRQQYELKIKIMFQLNWFWCISLSLSLSVVTVDQEAPQVTGKSHQDVRSYVRHISVIDNQRTLSQLSHRLEPRRTWFYTTTGSVLLYLCQWIS